MTRDDHATPKHFESLPVSDYVAERKAREARQRARQDAAHDKAKAEREATTIEPAPLTIEADGDTLRVTGSAHDLALLDSIAQLKTDAAALQQIQRLCGCDRDTARALLTIVRRGRPE